MTEETFIKMLCAARRMAADANEAIYFWNSEPDYDCTRRANGLMDQARTWKVLAEFFQEVAPKGSESSPECIIMASLAGTFPSREGKNDDSIVIQDMLDNLDHLCQIVFCSIRNNNKGDIGRDASNLARDILLKNQQMLEFFLDMLNQVEANGDCRCRVPFAQTVVCVLGEVEVSKRVGRKCLHSEQVIAKCEELLKRFHEKEATCVDTLRKNRKERLKAA